MDIHHCYEILNIPSSASYEEAKEAYRLLSQVWHPDKYAHSEKLHTLALEKMKEINAAWSALDAYFKSHAASDEDLGDRRHQSNDNQEYGNRYSGKVNFIIPLALTDDDLQNEVHHYMSGGAYTPKDIIDSSVFKKLEFLYVPAFIFGVEYKATWSASFGYDRTEPYTAYRTVTKNNHQIQEAYTAYRTVTDWKPASGEDRGHLKVSKYAGETLIETHLGSEDLVPIAIDDSFVSDYDISYIKQIPVEQFILSESDALHALHNKINDIIDNNIKCHGQGNRQKNWKCDLTPGN